MNKPLQLIESRGNLREVEDPIIACVTSWDGRYSAFATVEGDLWLIPTQFIKEPGQWQKIRPHHGGILALSQDMSSCGFITSGDDNRLVRIIPGHEPQEILKSKRWIDKIVTWVDDHGSHGQVALIINKEIDLYHHDFDKIFAVFNHSSGVSDMQFSSDGSKIVSAYYNGATLWSTQQAKDPKIKEFSWKGSHIGVALHPQEEAIVTSMQDHDLHGWRIADGHNMRMSGYPAKVKALSFSMDGKWLATSGAESVILWPFFDGGPMGKPPVELPGIPGSCCTMVSCHPSYDMLAAGFLDGSVLLISRADEKVIPICLGSQKPIGEITALHFNRQGTLLCFGTEEGTIGIVDLSVEK